MTGIDWCLYAAAVYLWVYLTDRKRWPQSEAASRAAREAARLIPEMDTDTLRALGNAIDAELDTREEA